MYLFVKAKPGSKVNKIVLGADGTLSVRINAPAHDGKANEALIRFLSETIRMPRSRIRIVSGFTSPFKKIEIDAEETFVRKKLGLL